MKQRGIYTNRQTNEYSPSLDNVQFFGLGNQVHKVPAVPRATVLPQGQPNRSAVNEAQHEFPKGWRDKNKKNKDPKSGDAKGYDEDKAGQGT